LATTGGDREMIMRSVIRPEIDQHVPRNIWGRMRRMMARNWFQVSVFFLKFNAGIRKIDIIY